MSHPLPGLAFAFKDDLFDLGVGWVDQELGAIETHATEDLHRLGQKSRMEHRLGQVQVPKVSGALRHVTGTGLAAGGAIHHTLTGIHQTAQLVPGGIGKHTRTIQIRTSSSNFVLNSPSTLHDLGKSDSPLRNRHSPDLLRGQDSELDPLDGLDRSLGVSGVDSRHVEALELAKSPQKVQLKLTNVPGRLRTEFLDSGTPDGSGHDTN